MSKIYYLMSNTKYLFLKFFEYVAATIFSLSVLSFIAVAGIMVGCVIIFVIVIMIVYFMWFIFSEMMSSLTSTLKNHRRM